MRPSTTRPSHPWLAVSVKPRFEKSVAEDLRNRAIEEFLPLYRSMRRWSDRTKAVDLPLFQGYVFCRFDFEERFKVLNTPGVKNVLTFGGKPATVTDSEIEAIRILIASGLPLSPWPYLKVGQRVRIDSGPLAGLEGILIREKDASRVVVGVEMLQRSVAAELDRASVSAARPVR